MRIWIDHSVEVSMNISSAIKVRLTNMIWLVVQVWIFFLELIKDCSLDHHEACADFHNFKRFTHTKLCGARHRIKNIITGQTFQLTWIELCLIKVRIGQNFLCSSKHIAPVDRLLWIRTTNNVLIKGN